MMCLCLLSYFSRVRNAVSATFMLLYPAGHLPKGYPRQKSGVPAVDRCQSNFALMTPLCAPIASSLLGLVSAPGLFSYCHLLSLMHRIQRLSQSSDESLANWKADKLTRYASSLHAATNRIECQINKCAWPFPSCSVCTCSDEKLPSSPIIFSSFCKHQIKEQDTAVERETPQIHSQLQRVCQADLEIIIKYGARIISSFCFSLIEPFTRVDIV